MLFRNYTPFTPLHFESRDEKQNDFGVVVLRGTFQIENGQTLTMVQEQNRFCSRTNTTATLKPQVSSLTAAWLPLSRRPISWSMQTLTRQAGFPKNTGTPLFDSETFRKALRLLAQEFGKKRWVCSHCLPSSRFSRSN